MEIRFALLCLMLLVCILEFQNVVESATFTLSNHCSYTVWPGILPNAGSQLLQNGGFELPPGESMTLTVPSGWSGRLWGRTGCSFTESGTGSCASGDCGGKLQCSGAGAATPATLAEFTIAGQQATVKQDFYDVSLVDGYNLPIAIVASGGSGGCATAGCANNLNVNCPASLQVLWSPNSLETETSGSSAKLGGASASQQYIVGCKSACDAFGDAEYCCSGAYANPDTCRPSVYSQIFKQACPKAYSYAYDDPTSTFTCTGADYAILYCPSSTSSQKSVTGINQPGSDLMGTQAYDTDTSAAAAATFSFNYILLLLLLPFLTAKWH